MHVLNGYSIDDVWFAAFIHCLDDKADVQRAASVADSAAKLVHERRRAEEAQQKPTPADMAIVAAHKGRTYTDDDLARMRANVTREQAAR